MKSILIKDTTKEEREQIIKESLDCVRAAGLAVEVRLNFISHILMVKRRSQRSTGNIMQDIREETEKQQEC